jgi:hypothetical protein
MLIISRLYASGLFSAKGAPDPVNMDRHDTSDSSQSAESGALTKAPVQTNRRREGRASDFRIGYVFRGGVKYAEPAFHKTITYKPRALLVSKTAKMPANSPRLRIDLEPLDFGTECAQA